MSNNLLLVFVVGTLGITLYATLTLYVSSDNIISKVDSTFGLSLPTPSGNLLYSFLYSLIPAAFAIVLFILGRMSVESEE